MGSQGIDIREAGSILCEVSLKDSDGAKVTAGPTELRYYRVDPSDGSLATYDFSDNTFKTDACSDDEVTLTHRQANNGSQDTGIWTYLLSTTTGFSAGDIIIEQVTNANAFPESQERVFQWGGGAFANVITMAADTITAAVLAASAGQELAALVETYIVNEGDATAVMQAIADKIAADWVAGDASPVAVAAAVKTAMEANGSMLDHLHEMTEDDGGTRRLTTNALEQGAIALLDLAGAIAGKTPRETLRYLQATAAGERSGAGTGTEDFKDAAGTVRVRATTDPAGNATVEYDPS